VKKRTLTIVGVAAGATVVAVWMLHFHTAFFTSHLPKWGWLQATLVAIGEKGQGAEADEDPDNTKNEIPVHVAKVTTATLRKYAEGVGTVGPRPARGAGAVGGGSPPGGAGVVPAMAGVVSRVAVGVGEQVKAGEVLLELDDRAARAAEAAAMAGLVQAEASLKALMGGPRPEQLEMAKLAVGKARAALGIAEKGHDRAVMLAAGQGVSAKMMEQATNDLAAARTDLATAEQQLLILQNTPAPEDVAVEQAKVAVARATLAAATTQLSLLKVVAPMDGTVTSIPVGVGDGVDSTRAVAQLVALDRLGVMVQLAAEDVPEKVEGLVMRVGEDVEVKVTAASPAVEGKSGSVTVWADLPPATRLRPGQSVRVRLVVAEHAGVLAVPVAAVVADENGDGVIALIDKDQATHKSVERGIEENGFVEIRADGLTEGMTVATAGAYGLPQATRVKVVP
jgi:HlyD family secretion protein